MPPNRITIAQHLLQLILEHCLEERPCEACGILTGRDGRVLHAYATENARHSPTYYEVEAGQQERVLQLMAARGEELVGIYHSHPTAPARPSESDIRLAVYYPEAVRLIISLAGPVDVQAFAIREGKATVVGLVAPGDQVGQWHDLRKGMATEETG